MAAWIEPAAGVKEVHDDIWLVSFTNYDLGYFDLEKWVLESAANQSGPKFLPLWPVHLVTCVSGLDPLTNGGEEEGSDSTPRRARPRVLRDRVNTQSSPFRHALPLLQHGRCRAASSRL